MSRRNLDSRNAKGSIALVTGTASFLAMYLGSSPAVASSIDDPVTVRIAANTPLDVALVQFSRQTGIQMMFVSEVVSDKTTVSPVAGTLRASEALSGLLE